VADSPFRERRYRTDEVRSVVRNALARDADPGAGRALTRDELSAVLADLGVSAEAAARSMDEVGAPAEDSAENQADWLGGPKRIVFEGEVDGELADDRREDVVEIVREVLGDAGRVEALGRTVTWAPTPSANNQQRRLSVKIRVRDGRTRIRIDEDLSPVRAGSWLGFGLGGGLGLGTLAMAAGKATQSAAVAVVVWMAILAASLLAGWAVTRAVSNRRKRDLRKLFDKVREEVVRSSTPRAASSSSSPAASSSPSRARIAPETAGDEASEREQLAEDEAAATDGPVPARATPRR
jgi:hypothetical protein